MFGMEAIPRSSLLARREERGSTKVKHGSGTRVGWKRPGGSGIEHCFDRRRGGFLNRRGFLNNGFFCNGLLHGGLFCRRFFHGCGFFLSDLLVRSFFDSGCFICCDCFLHCFLFRRFLSRNRFFSCPFRRCSYRFFYSRFLLANGHYLLLQCSDKNPATILSSFKNLQKNLSAFFKWVLIPV